MKATEVRLADYSPPKYRIPTTNLDITIFDQSVLVQSRLRIVRNGTHQDPLVLDGIGLKLKSVAVNGKALSAEAYHLDAETLALPGLPADFELTILNEIDPYSNKALEGFYRSGSILCTQCEAQGFRKITYFQDRPDVLSSFTVTLRGDKTKFPLLLAGGNLIAAKDVDGGRHEVTWQDPFPKPCYLFAMVAGDLACRSGSFTTRSGRSVELSIFTEPENLHKTSIALDALNLSMKWDEDRFGLEYDLDSYMIVAVNDFNMGAMENKGLNIFNSTYALADETSATDTDVKNIYNVIGHEYFHNWTGNRVTLRDWFQLSLKEGLTVYRDQEFSADLGSAGIKRIDDVIRLKTSQFAEDQGPLAHPVKPKAYLEINNFYTVTIYEKGAELVRMIANWLGKDAFARALKHYLTKFDGQAATTEDFIEALQESSGIDLNHFRKWYDIAGTPEIKLEFQAAPAQSGSAASERELTIKALQTNPKAKELGNADPILSVPLKVGFYDPLGARPQLQPLSGGIRPEADGSFTLVIDRESQEFRFKGAFEKLIPSVNQGFSAPVKVETQLDERDLYSLYAFDQDAYCRYEAGQTIMKSLLISTCQQLRAGRTPSLPKSFLDAIGSNLERYALDPQLSALLMTLPTHSLIVQWLGRADIRTVYAAVDHLYAEIALHKRQELLSVYHSCAAAAKDADFKEASAWRSLKNTVLSILMHREDEEIAELCFQQVLKASCMSDEIEALGDLVHSRSEARREDALRRFHAKWKKDFLVTNKWFAVQAQSRLPDGFERFKALMHHPDFRLDNPNRCRAVLGVLVRYNLLHFHGNGGEPYQLVMQKIAEIDAFNPQLASAIAAAALSQIRCYPEEQERLMVAELSRLVEGKLSAGGRGLSKDLFEVADKTLKFLS